MYIVNINIKIFQINYNINKLNINYHFTLMQKDKCKSHKIENKYELNW